jgi:hypothetical protein
MRRATKRELAAKWFTRAAEETSQARGHAVAGGEHHVEAGEIELLDGGGEERQIPPVVPADAGRPLQEAGADGVRLDGRADAAGKMEEGEDGRFGKERAEGLEHLLAAAHAGEPVVHQRHARHLTPCPLS